MNPMIPTKKSYRSVMRVLILIGMILPLILLNLPVKAQSFLSQQADPPETGQQPYPLPVGGQFQATVMTDEKESALDEEQQDLMEDQSEYLSMTRLDIIAELADIGEYNKVLSLLQSMVDIPPDVSWTDEFMLYEYRLFLLIKAHFHLGHQDSVIDLSDIYMNQYVNGAHFHWIYYYLSSVLYSQGKSLRSVYLVTEEFFTKLPKQERHQLRRYLINNEIQNREFLSAIYFLEDETGELIEGYGQWIDTIIKNINELEDVDQILERYQNDSIYFPLQKRRIQLMIRDGMIAEAEEYYYDLMLNSGDKFSHLGQLSAIYAIIQRARDTKPYRIGVILPVSHERFNRLATQTLDGLEMAMGKVVVNGKPIQLVVRDSAEKDSQTQFQQLSPRMQLLEKQKLVKKHVKDLVETEGVIAIVGPLTRGNSIAAGEAADRYRIPILSFSLTENIGEDLSYLFRFQRSQLQEAEVLAAYACDYLNAKRFVIFYNQGSTSFNVMKRFTEKVKEKEGTIVGISRINRGQKDFSEDFRSFTGGLKPIPEEELEELKRTREEPEPIVDFDAIFLPTGTRTLKVVMDFAKFYNAENAWFLSGSDVNVRENQLLENIRKLRFVGTFPVSGVNTYLQPFFEEHWKYFNYRPHYFPPTDYTIYGYESLELLGQLLANPQNQNREALRNAVKALNGLEVLTGSVSAKEYGELEKQQKVLKIVGTETVEVF